MLRASIPQLALYADLVRPLAQAYGDRPIQLEWLVLTKTQSPSIEKHRVDLDVRQVARIKTVVRRVWDAIVAGSFYPAPSATSCSTCPYRTVCQRWEG